MMTQHRRPAPPPPCARAACAVVAVVAALSLAGCAAPRFAAVTLPESLAVPPDETRALVLLASGVQLYECRAAPGAPASAEWVHRGPEATLSDDADRVVGQHGPGMTWQAPDGSRIVGTVNHKVDAPVEGAMPWLVMEARAAGKPAGRFGHVRHVQRVATKGGAMPPAERCTPAEAGHVERVPFEAQFWFYEKRWNW